MMGVKGKLLKKLKTIKTIGYLKPESEAHFYASRLKSTPTLPVQVQVQVEVEVEPKKRHNTNNLFPVQEPEIIDVSELMKDLEDQEMDFDDEMDEKENHKPKEKFENSQVEVIIRRPSPPPKAKHEEVSSDIIDVSRFRRPDLNSKTLFDPDLLAAFEQAINEVKARETERRSRIIEVPCLWEVEDDEPPLKTRKVKQSINNPLLEFEDKCPPGGSDSIVVYTTGLRAIRKTFEDCQKMRSLLENLRVLFFERDISMHSGFKEELWEVLGGKIGPPRLFIRGRYVGGVDEVLGLHEQGKLKPLIEGIPTDLTDGPCEGCVGYRFIVCFNCKGSRKILPEGDRAGGGEPMKCSECNENGVLICPFCC